MQHYLVVGLGNYPVKYQTTRHNVGQVALQQFCQQLQLNWVTTVNASLVAVFQQTHRSFYFLKPHCYMNDSGELIAKVMRHHHIPFANLVVLYDDLDVELGKIKIKTHGSAAGHNGVQSLITWLGTDQFIRLRIGIKPATQVTAVMRKRFVLAPFTVQEQHTLRTSHGYVSQILSDWMNQDYAWTKIISLYQQRNSS